MKPQFPRAMAPAFCLCWALLAQAQAASVDDAATNGLAPYAGGGNALQRAVVPSEPLPAERQFIINGAVTNITVPDVVARLSPPPTIQLVDGGARADYGRLPVGFSADVNSEFGTIRLEGPGPAYLSVRPTWLAYADDTGKSLRIGEIRSRIGGVAGNVVIYTNVFEGAGLRADVRYVYHANELHQDIVLHTLPTPEASLSGEVYLQIWSEVLSMSAAQKEVRGVELRPGASTLIEDESADFGPFKLVTGRTFSLGQEDGEHLPVAKSLYQDPASGRVFIVETVVYASVRDLLAHGNARSETAASNGMASVDLRQTLPARASLAALNRPMLLASVEDLPTEGVVLDYVIVASVPLPANAISWWPAGGNANDALGINNGTPQGNAAYTAGLVGRGFSLDGNGAFVHVANSTSLSPTNAITVETWVYWASNATTFYGDLVSKDGEVSGRQWLLNAARSGPFRPHVWTQNGMVQFDGNTTASAETWYHVAMTYDSATSNLILYVNGVEDGRASGSGYILAGTEPVRIGGGAPAYTAQYYFHGKIDEPAVYSRALSANEIYSIYAAGAAGKHNPNCQSSPSEIVGWWPGDDTAEDFANTNTATWVGAAAYGPANVSSGFQTSAGDFWNGGSFLEVGDRPEFNPPDAVTLEAWVYATPSPYGHRIIMGKDAEYGVRQYMMALTSGNRLRVHVWNTNGVPTWFDGNTTVSSNTWYHVVMTYNRTNLILYVNGAQDGSVNATHPIRTGTQPLRIGSSAPYPQRAPYSFSGLIDEASIYNRALSASEVSALYAAGYAGKCKIDADADGLTDLQEAWIGTNPILADTDGDGVTDGEEHYLNLGTNPLLSDSDGDGILDGDEDYDGDLLSNAAELRMLGSDPSNPHTFNTNKIDSEFKLTAQKDDTEVELSDPTFDGSMIQFSVAATEVTTAWDIYYTPDLNAGSQFKIISSGSPGQTVFKFPTPYPNPGSGFFRAGLASSDLDGDGLSDGYEVVASRTVIGVPSKGDSDGDTLPDAWEVEYGLDPRPPAGATGDNGGEGNPDGEAPNNRGEWTNRTDPWRISLNERPEVTMAVVDGGFVITRTGSTSSNLTVNYTVGGTAVYGSDYSLSPAPGSAYPFAITVPGGSASVWLAVTPNSGLTGSKSVKVALAPFATTVAPAVWTYVVDPRYDRGTLTIATHSYPGPCSRRTDLMISEIMYHPATGNEFIEIYNSGPTSNDISGYKLTAKKSAFSTELSGTLAASGQPAAFQVVTLSGQLDNRSDTVRLLNRQGAVLLEVTYADSAPWPVAADGAGHSLVLAHSSYGENNPAAWAASARAGGSPESPEPCGPDPLSSICINEFLANPPSGQVDFIELYNHSAVAVNVGGCRLSDDDNPPEIYQIPANTIIGAGGFLAIDRNQSGINLDKDGDDKVLLNSPNLDHVVDAIAFEAQEAGVSSGRYRDGDPTVHELSTRTPGAANAPLLIRDIAINEILYNPISGDSDHEYIELYNRGTNSSTLSGWQLAGDISFTFPTVTLPSGGYMVVAKKKDTLIGRYEQGYLTTANTAGDYTNSLPNSSGRLILKNSAGVVIDDVTYHDGGRWGQWSDGGGSSLELIDPRSDNRLPSNWADSDETGKGVWQEISVAGPRTNSHPDVPNIGSLEAILLGPGECVLDDVQFIPQGGVNLVLNSTFDAGLGSWTNVGNHSMWQTNAGHSGYGLLPQASGRGDNGANKLLANLSSTVSGTSGAYATNHAWVRWRRGHPQLLLRAHGNSIEAVADLDPPTNLGTPGHANSCAANNVGPAIHEVRHSPVVPEANQPVLVTARVHDPDGVATVMLRYRIDPSVVYTNLAMRDDGSGCLVGS